MAGKAKKGKRAPKKPRQPAIDAQALAARGALVDGALAEAHARLGRLEGRVVRLEVAMGPGFGPLPARCNIVGCTNPPSGAVCVIPSCPRRVR